MATIKVGFGPSYPAADYDTIQAAIDAANPGDTVTVGAGIYNEQVIIDKPLTLLGAGAYRNPVDGGRPGGETVLESTFPVMITANGVTVNGFEIRNFRFGVYIPAVAFEPPNSLIQNINIACNWIHSDAALVGFNAEPGLLRNLAINNNIIRVNHTAGLFALAAISFSRGATKLSTYENVEISDNEIANLSGEYGIYAAADPGAYLVNGMVMRCNRFRNAPSGENIHIGNICNGQLISNVFEDCGASIGMQFGSVIGNTFKTGGNLSLLGTENGYSRPSMHVAITNNNFTDEASGNGLRIRLGALSYTITAHSNAFRNSGIQPTPPPNYSMGYLIRNEGLGALDATLNWWDSSQGPSGNAGGLAGTVTTSPWIPSYTDDPSKQTPPACWPLSTFLTAEPGFWPVCPTGVSYIGRTCFGESECVVLIALVSYSGGDGSGIVVGFDFNTLSIISQTLAGGVAYVCLGILPEGVYNLTVRAAGYFTDTTEIRIGNCGGPDKT